MDSLQVMMDYQLEYQVAPKNKLISNDSISLIQLSCLIINEIFFKTIIIIIHTV